MFAYCVNTAPDFTPSTLSYANLVAIGFPVVWRFLKLLWSALYGFFTKLAEIWKEVLGHYLFDFFSFWSGHFGGFSDIQILNAFLSIDPSSWQPMPIPTPKQRLRWLVQLLEGLRRSHRPLTRANHNLMFHKILSSFCQNSNCGYSKNQFGPEFGSDNAGDGPTGHPSGDESLGEKVSVITPFNTPHRLGGGAASGIFSPDTDDVVATTHASLCLSLMPLLNFLRCPLLYLLPVLLLCMPLYLLLVVVLSL